MFEPEKVYHIYNRANGKENLFIEDQNYRFFLDKYFKHIDPIAETFAYCLMPNHFHFMIRIRNEKMIKNNLGSETFQKFGTFGKLTSKQFSNLFSSYTQSLNKVYYRTGSLFQPNLKKKEVTSDAYFTKLVLYIHNNPVKHGFVRNLHDWKFSSVHELREMCSTRLGVEVINWFGGIHQFEDAHQQIATFQSVFD